MSSLTKYGAVRTWRRGKRSRVRGDLRRMVKHGALSQAECDRVLRSIDETDDFLVALDARRVRSDRNRLTDGCAADVKKWITFNL